MLGREGDIECVLVVSVGNMHLPTLEFRREDDNEGSEYPSRLFCTVGRLEDT